LRFRSSTLLDAHVMRETVRPTKTGLGESPVFCLRATVNNSATLRRTTQY
jgi:hypothetical protein